MAATSIVSVTFFFNKLAGFYPAVHWLCAEEVLPLELSDLPIEEDPGCQVSGVAWTLCHHYLKLIFTD